MMDPKNYELVGELLKEHVRLINLYRMISSAYTGDVLDVDGVAGIDSNRWRFSVELGPLSLIPTELHREDGKTRYEEAPFLFYVEAKEGISRFSFGYEWHKKIISLVGQETIDEIKKIESQLSRLGVDMANITFDAGKDNLPPDYRVLLDNPDN